MIVISLWISRVRLTSVYSDLFGLFMIDIGGRIIRYSLVALFCSDYYSNFRERVIIAGIILPSPSLLFILSIA